MTCLDGFGGPSDRAPRAAIREAPWIERRISANRKAWKASGVAGWRRDDPQPAPRDEEAEEGERTAPGHGRLPMLDAQAEASELRGDLLGRAPLRLGPGRARGGQVAREGQDPLGIEWHSRPPTTNPWSLDGVQIQRLR